MGNGLDDVVPVEVLQRLEEVEGTSRAAGPADVHVDDGETHQVGDHGDAVHRAGGVGVAVAGVLDQRRGRPEGGVGELEAPSSGPPPGRSGGWTSIASLVPSRVVR